MNRQKQIITFVGLEQASLKQSSAGKIHTRLNRSRMFCNPALRFEDGLQILYRPVQSPVLIDRSDKRQVILTCKPRPQCIVVPHDRLQRQVKALRIEPRIAVEHNRLVKMMALLEVLAEEPLLDRSQAERSFHVPLININRQLRYILP
ncbi:hypothetical protein D3C84_864980 [compost metagenome]